MLLSGGWLTFSTNRDKQRADQIIKYSSTSVLLISYTRHTLATISSHLVFRVQYSMFTLESGVLECDESCKSVPEEIGAVRRYYNVWILTDTECLSIPGYDDYYYRCSGPLFS